MSNIIHMRIPLNENGQPLIDTKKVVMAHNHIREYLGEDYKVITTPFYVNKVDGNIK